jgi:MSHA pilin protein MshA
MKNRGFTLVEMLVVIMLIGILAANALPRFLGVSNDAMRAFNNATVGTLNAAVNAAAQKAKLPGGLITITGFTAGVNNGSTSVYVVNIDNNTNIAVNNYLAFNSSGIISIGGATGAYANTPTSTTISSTYADITGSVPATGCTNLFNILMGSGSAKTAVSGTTSSTYQTLVSSPAGSTAFTTINGITGSTFSSGSIAAGKLASTVLASTAAVPGTSGACLYLLNNSVNPLFFIIYDAAKGLFYAAEF